jgi:site-specific DNA-methyltransferase (adenine-specific)
VADVRLYNADCLDVLPTLEAGSVDAVVTDPPYNVGLDYATYKDRREDYQAFSVRWLNAAKSICKGPIAVSVGQSNLSMWASAAPPDWWLAWWKPAAMGRCVVGFNNWEPIALYRKPKKDICDVVRATIRPDDSLSGHPCPKPLGWATRQVEMLTEEDETVLDPFMGSGTVGVACALTRRRFVGIEIDPGYFALAERRIRQARQAVADEARFFGQEANP